MRDKLEALAPDLREEIREQRLATLTPEESAARDSKLDSMQMSPEQNEARSRAWRKMTVTDMDLAEAMPDDLKTRAKYYVRQIAEKNVYVQHLQSYSTVVNYEYWKTRCEVEQSKVTADARRYMMFGDDAAEKGDPEGAREWYEKAWDEWVKIFDDYPQLIKDEMAEDLNDVIIRYKGVLDQLDEPFPRDFKLQELVDYYQSDEGPPIPPRGDEEPPTADEKPPTADEKPPSADENAPSADEK